MGRIIRLQEVRSKRTEQSERAKRHSTASVYSSGRAVREKRSGRFSTKEVYRKPAPQRTPSGRLIREHGPIVRSGGGQGLANDYALRLGKGAIARIQLTRESETQARIDWVFVPGSFRGQGVAGRILAAVIEDADARGLTLVLEARACAGLEQAALEAWYGRFGFEPSGRSETFGPLLVRNPQIRRRRAA